MSILIYANTVNNKIHKSAYEAVSYGAQIAEKSGDTVIAIVTGSVSNAESLGKYGADQIHILENDIFNNFQPTAIAEAIQKSIETHSADTVIFTHDLSGKSIAPLVAAKMNAGIVAGAIELPNTDNGFVVKKAVFSGKAYAYVKINTTVKIISVTPNAVEKKEYNKEVPIESTAIDLAATRLVVKEQKMESTDLPLTEAEKVVSAGRGLKGPENWGMIEELAKELGAATACSRPVSDMDWRPHHEHVGQTGVAIRPNLYIAVGISGAIQHLAGVNQSKVIVVINTDAEAPFFKSADYGIVGDAFDVVPKLLEAAKAMNLSAN